jgi:hypothetical protein
LLKDLVESPGTAKARGRGHLYHRQSRVLDQLLGEKDPPGLGDRDRGSTKMLPEQAPELTLAKPQSRRQGLDIRAIQGPRFNQAKGSGYAVGASLPEGELG